MNVTRTRTHAATGTLRVRARIGWIDGARGLSIVAMIVSHVGLALDLTPEWFHVYVMRPVAPMFLLLLGMLWRPGLRRRHLQFAGGVVAAALLSLSLGFGFPNILTLMAVALLVMPLMVRFPVVTLAACVTQLAYWPHPNWWTGYPLGLVLAMVLVGHLVSADGAVQAYGRFGDRLGLGVVGRYPLSFYVGHLAVLAFHVHVVA